MENIMEILTIFGLSEFEATAFVKICLASVCGGLIGLERELKGRPAGLKTFSLVCMGATLAMVTNEYIVMFLNGGAGDLARMAAQVISGIGFLGAGTIIVTGNNQVRGLTTAATLWVTAALGISIGSGFYFGGVAGLAVIYVCSFLYGAIDRKIMEKSRIMRIYIEGMDENFMLRLVDFMEGKQIRVLSLQRKSENKWFKKDTCAMIEMDFGKKRKHAEFLDELRALEGLRYVEEI